MSKKPYSDWHFKKTEDTFNIQFVCVFRIFMYSILIQRLLWQVESTCFNFLVKKERLNVALGLLSKQIFGLVTRHRHSGLSGITVLPFHMLLFKA